MTTTARLTHLRRAARTAPARAKARSDAEAARQRSAADPSAPVRRPRRLGRQRGPQRVQMSVRLLPEIDDWVTAACDQTGRHLQYVVEELLVLGLKELGVPKPSAPQHPEAITQLVEPPTG